MLIKLQILDSIMGFQAHMIAKIQGLISIYYQLQNNRAVLLCRLSDGHAFLDLDLDKIWSLINLSYSYFLISLHNLLISPDKQQFIALVIILAIMARFFFSTDSYGLSEKAYTSRFFTLFYGKKVVVICFILAVAIQDFALRWNNKELVIRKDVIWFKPTSQKKATSI